MKLNEIQSPSYPPAEKSDVTLETKLKRVGRTVMQDMHAKFAPQFIFTWERRGWKDDTQDTQYYVSLEFDKGTMASQSKTRTRTYMLEFRMAKKRGVMNITDLLDTDDDEAAQEIKKKYAEKSGAKPLKKTPSQVAGELFDEVIAKFKAEFPALKEVDIREVDDNVRYDRYSFTDARARFIQKLGNKNNSGVTIRLVFDDQDKQTFHPGPYLTKIDAVLKRIVEKQGHIFGFPFKSRKLVFSSVREGNELILYPRLFGDSYYDMKKKRAVRTDLQFDRMSEIRDALHEIMELAKPRIAKMEMPATFEVELTTRPNSEFMKDDAKWFEPADAKKFLNQPVVVIRITQK